jgi:hypothetical protein
VPNLFMSNPAWDVQTNIIKVSDCRINTLRNTRDQSSLLLNNLTRVKKVCVSCGVQDGPKNSTSPFLPWMSQNATKGLIALKTEIHYDQTAMGLPPVTSVVFLVAK